MKYIVARRTPESCDELFVFPAIWNHNEFFNLLKVKFPEMTAVSAGNLYNYTTDVGGYEYDQIRLSGESITLGVKARHEHDLSLFRRMADGM